MNEIFKTCYSLDDLPQLLEAVHSPLEEKHSFATQGFRKILSFEHNHPIQELIGLVILPYLIDWIQKFDYPQLQFESA